MYIKLIFVNFWIKIIAEICFIIFLASSLMIIESNTLFIAKNCYYQKFEAVWKIAKIKYIKQLLKLDS